MTYTPEPDYSGPDSFVFIVNDGAADSNEATVSLTVTAVNDAPTANHKSLMTKINRSASISLTGNDIDSDTLKFTVCTQPEYGTLSFGSNFEINGKLVYTPRARFTGSDSFTFKLNDRRRGRHTGDGVDQCHSKPRSYGGTSNRSDGRGYAGGGQFAGQ
jgi:hypothetical protein